MSPTTRTVITVILSLLILGLGHIFVGRVKRGMVILLLGFIGALAISFIVPFPYSLPFIAGIYIFVIWDLFKIVPKDVSCKDCGKLNPEGSTFCAKCGAALKVNDSSITVACQKCANMNIEGSAFCARNHYQKNCSCNR